MAGRTVKALYPLSRLSVLFLRPSVPLLLLSVPLFPATIMAAGRIGKAFKTDRATLGRVLGRKARALLKQGLGEKAERAFTASLAWHFDEAIQRELEEVLWGPAPNSPLGYSRGMFGVLPRLVPLGRSPSTPFLRRWLVSLAADCLRRD